MGRPRTIHISTDELLKGVHNAWLDAIADLESEIAASQADQAENGNDWQGLQHIMRSQRKLAYLKNFGPVPYRLEQFLGRQLTNSEAVVARSRMSELKDAGLLTWDGRRAVSVALTPAGVAHLQELSQ